MCPLHQRRLSTGNTASSLSSCQTHKACTVVHPQLATFKKPIVCHTCNAHITEFSIRSDSRFERFTFNQIYKAYKTIRNELFHIVLKNGGFQQHDMFVSSRNAENDASHHCLYFIYFIYFILCHFPTFQIFDINDSVFSFSNSEAT